MSVSYLRAHRLQLHRSGLVATTTPHFVPLPPAPAPVTSGPAPRIQPVTVDPLRRTAVVHGQPLALTKVEFDLLAHLVSRPHQVFTRDQLIEAVWHQPAIGDGRTVDVHVVRLRRKLGQRFRAMLVTVRGVGYKYEPQAC
ncbi:DNA-binding response OmpR family regulator [Streptacidiphilus sp. BW17]|uniref:winged helix-turn-helix domain-containing protein n=1 Tax=Streptacidiphilus sp. BW17 TaxID=3156274 RepID=UPI0035136268